MDDPGRVAAEDGAQGQGAPVPASVQAVIAARLDALPAEDKAALGDAAVIGEVTDKPAEQVLLRTRVGGHRILNLLRGEQLPRIC